MLALLAAFYAPAWLALSWGCPPPAQAAGNGATEQYVLPNGLKVLIREDHSFPVVATLAWYRVGSRNETMGSTGITHLVEHLLFGTVGSFRKGEIGALVARNGGQFNAFTSDDFTTFFEVLPPSRLELALRIESARMSAALFSQKEVEEEIARVQEELEEGEKDFVDVLAREVRAAAYQQHPYHNPTTGWRTDLENITVQQVQAYYKQFFRPDNATLVIVGDVKSNLALALVRKYFEPVAKGQGAVPVVTIVEPAQKGERRVVVRYSGNREVLQVAYHAPAMHDADGPAMYVLEKLLSAHHSGRLRARLMNTKVCSWAQAGFEGKRDPGLFSITCYAAPGSLQEEILEAVDNMIAQLRAYPVAEAELKRARNQAEFGYLTERDGPYRFGFHLGFADSLGEWQKALTWTERLRAVTAADVQRVAKRYLNPDNRVIGWLSTPNAPKPPPPKSPPAESQPPREPRSPQRQALAVPLTGYKTDDAAPGPASGVTARTAQQASVEPSGASKRQGVGGLPASTTAGAAPGVARAGQPAAAATAGCPATAGMAPLLPPMPKIGSARSELTEPRSRTIQQRVLKNGVTVVIMASHLAPIVQIIGAVRAGDVYDPPGKRGVSAVTAACLNYGSSRHNRSQLWQLQEDIGLPPPAMLKFEGGTETITFQTRCLSRDFALQVGNLADILTGPAFTDSDVEKAKQETSGAFKRADDSLAGRVERALLRSLIVPGSAYYPGDWGDLIRSVSALKAPDLKSFHQQYIVPGATTIVIAGDVTAEQAVHVLEKALATWTGKGVHTRPPVQVASRKIMRTTLPTREGAESMMCIGQLLGAPGNRQEYAQVMAALCVLVGHPIIARVGQSWGAEPVLAQKVGLGAVQSRLEPVGNLLKWSLSLVSPADAMAKAMQALLSETRKLAKAGVAPEELVEVKRYLTGAVPVRQMASLSVAARSILDSVTAGGEADFVPRLLGALSASTAESVNRTIRSLLKPDEATMVIAAGPQTMKNIREQVLSARPKPAGTQAR